jgi:hypothetical protein
VDAHRREGREAPESDLGLSLTSRYAGRETMEAKAACMSRCSRP